MAAAFAGNFVTFNEFAQALASYEEANNVRFRKQRSETIEYSNNHVYKKNPVRRDVGYRYIQLVCTHFGEPNIGPSRGKRKVSKYNATGCCASIYVAYSKKHDALIIDQTKTELDHANHEISPSTYQCELKNRKLNNDELRLFKDWVELDPSNEKLLERSNKMFGKKSTLTEVRHAKSRVKCESNKDDIADLLDFLDDLEQKDGGKVKVVVSDDNSEKNILDIAAFATHDMIHTYHSYPGMIFIDGTYKVNKAGFPLYQVMVEDAQGRARPVFYAVTRRETEEMITKLLRIFQEMVSDIAQTSVVMSDKCDSEAAAILHVFPEATHILCYFHVKKALKDRAHTLKNVSRETKNELLRLAFEIVDARSEDSFEHHYKMLQEAGNEEWTEYFDTYWMNCKVKWALSERKKIVNYLNDTDNKCESSHKFYKRFLDGHTRLTDLFMKLVEHSIVQQGDMNCAAIDATMSSIHYRDSMAAYRKVYDMFSKHGASLMISDHNQFGHMLEIERHEGHFDVRVGEEAWQVLDSVPLSCCCQFHTQTLLPCCHIMAVQSKFDLPLENIVVGTNRYLVRNMPNVLNAPLSHSFFNSVEVRQVVPLKGAILGPRPCFKECL